MRSTLKLLTIIYVLGLLGNGVVGAQGLRQAPSGWVEEAPSQAAPQSSSGSKPYSPSVIKQPAGAGKHGGLVLQGGVEHAQELPSLPRSLLVGSRFDDKLATAPPVVDDWYWIPDWLAGDWRRDSEIIVTTYDFKTGSESHQPREIAATEMAQFGVQKDRFGGIWNCRLATSGVADCGSYFSVALVQEQKPIVVSANLVVIRDLFTELHVNKETNVITYSAQAESLSRYEALGAGKLKTSVSVKEFDEGGMPSKQEEHVSVTNRVRVFFPLDEYKGHDLRAAFKRFLISQGKADYAP